MSEIGARQQEGEDDFSKSGVIRTMLIFGGVSFVIFGLIYMTLWKRASAREGEGEDVESTGTDQNEEEQSENSSSNNSEENSDEPVNISEEAPARKFVHALVPREDKPGDPIFDNLLIRGTASLGVLLCIGATVVLIVSLVDRAKYDGAKPDDFASVGTNGCRVVDTVRYGYYDVRKSSVNLWCVEEWEYSVEITGLNITFEPAGQTSDDCRSTCATCLSQGRLYGEDYYVGYDPLRPGSPITDETYAGCFEPTVPVDSLSGFYDCGRQRAENGTCYLLEDTAEILDKGLESVELGLKATYASYGAGFILTLLAVYFVYRNKKVRKLAEENEESKDESQASGEGPVDDAEERSGQLDMDASAVEQPVL